MSAAAEFQVMEGGLTCQLSFYKLLYGVGLRVGWGGKLISASTFNHENERIRSRCFSIT